MLGMRLGNSIDAMHNLEKLVQCIAAQRTDSWRSFMRTDAEREASLRVASRCVE